jgi:hypothetical protein
MFSAEFVITLYINAIIIYKDKISIKMSYSCCSGDVNYCDLTLLDLCFKQEGSSLITVQLANKWAGNQLKSFYKTALNYHLSDSPNVCL